MVPHGRAQHPTEPGSVYPDQNDPRRRHASGKRNIFTIQRSQASGGPPRRKNGVTVSVTKDIDALIRLKNRSAGFLGFITTTGAKNFGMRLRIRKKPCSLPGDRMHKLWEGSCLLAGTVYHTIGLPEHCRKANYCPNPFGLGSTQRIKNSDAKHSILSASGMNGCPPKTTNGKGLLNSRKDSGGHFTIQLLQRFK